MDRDATGRPAPPLPPIDNLLIDRNNDGYPDDIAGLIVVPEPIESSDWAAILNLSARLGLGTSGFSPPMVATEPLTGRVSLRIRPGDASRLNSLAASAESTGSPEEAPPDGVPEIDLADPWSIQGLLVDRDGDQMADDSAVHLHLPAEVPYELGAALADFAARVGVECIALRLPLAGGATPSNRIALAVEITDSERARLEHEPDGGLRLTGSSQSLADFISSLASMSSGFLPEKPVSRGIEWLRRSAAGRTLEGRAAQLRSVLEQHRPERLVILEHDPGYRRHLHHIAAECSPETGIDLAGTREAVAFDHQWTAEWEVDRLLKTLDEDILPSLDPAEPVHLIAMVSEPMTIRRRVRGQITRRMLELGFSQGTVHVLDAFKPGLCWLQEVVLPEFLAIEEIHTLTLRFRDWKPENHDGQLDMPIRWLQELFPVDEILAGALGLPLENVKLESSEGQESIYTIVARDRNGDVVLERSFSPLWRRIDYLAGMPGAGNVTVTTGGVIAEQAGETKRARVLTDPEVFWRYVQGELQPHLRRFILSATNLNPTVTDQPFFDDLFVDLHISASDEPYDIRQERHSAAEALHEDIYFNILDFVEELGQETTGEKLSAPGPVRPFVNVVQGRQPEARARLTSRAPGIARMISGTESTTIQPAAVGLPSLPGIAALEYENGRLIVDLAGSDEVESLAPFLRALSALSPVDDASTSVRVQVKGEAVEIGVPDPAVDDLPPETASEPVPTETIISNDEIFPHLNRLSGHPAVRLVPAAERSWQGRPIPAVALTAPQSAEIWSLPKFSGFKPTMLIVARHHANEVASTTSALRLIELVTTEPEWTDLLEKINIVLLPLENPDGAALHDLLRRDNPTWKHHPARYNATGYEFGEDQGVPDSPYGEGRVRDLVWNACLPDIVVDNHGVPSHEWAQLFAGFGSPPRFPVSYWQVQALLYGIMPLVDIPGHQEVAEALRDRVASLVAADEDLLHWNQVYTERYRTWGHQWDTGRFPLTLYQEMLFHMNPVDPDSQRARRSYALRYPKTTVINWVTEVCDETVEGGELERTAQAHLLANRAALDLLRDSAPALTTAASEVPDGVSLRVGRERPLRVS